jgi:sugar phosphate isomerase/epimerase
LVGNHHGHQQHTKWLGADPLHRYSQYYEGLAEIRTVLRRRGVNLMSVSPFLKLDDAEGDFVRLCDELGQPLVVQGEDISDTDHPARFVEKRPSRSRWRQRLARSRRSRP